MSVLLIDSAAEDLRICQIIAKKHQATKARKIDFALTIDRVRDLVKRGRCEYTKVPFDSEEVESKLTLERINPLVGYTDSNTVAVAHWVNQLKGQTLDVFLHDKRLTDQQKLKMLHKVVYHLGKQIKSGK